MKPDHHINGRAHVTETPDVSHTRNVDVTREVSDVNIRGIMTFLGGLTVLTIVVYLLMWGMFRVLYTQEETKDEPTSPMAMTGKERLPPEPRLQGAPGFGKELEEEAGVKESTEAEDTSKPRDPLWEINVLREHWKSTLENGVKDSSGKFVVLPIKQAKQELLKQGLPVRQTSQ
jgi:hypothetical protein